MAATYETHLVPGGAVGTNPQPTAAPWELNHAFGIGGVAGALWQGGAGVMQNQALAASGLVGWRSQVPLAGAVNTRAMIQIGGTAAGVGGQTRISPIASVMSGAIGGYALTKAGSWFMEGDVRLTTVTPDAAEIIFVFAPSWVSASGVIGTANGFGLVWANTLANNNWHLVIADASGALFASVDTGIVANDSVIKLLRLEYGAIGGLPMIRALINGLEVAVINGPLVLDTATKLGAFNQMVCVGGDKMQASLNNSTDAWIGTVLGLHLGRIA